jgi:tetratricopeptide (TPR) repeat protein
MNLDFYSLTPTVLPVYSHLGAHYFQNQDYDKSIEYYSKALIYNPHHVHVLNDLGSSYYAKGDIETAENFYKKALDINPIFTKSLMNYTSLKFNRGDIDGALNMILEVVIEWEPENYKLFISTIAKSKCQWLIDLHDQPDFEVFLREVMSNDELMYEISVNCRKSGACYEDELRIYFSNL